MNYPVGIHNFERIIKEGYVYVDKTDMVYSLADQGAFYFLSRPRRFGKSLLLSTLDCYFSGQKELFEGLKIAELEKDWKQHAVFWLDFKGVNFTIPGALEKELDRMVSSWEEKYGIDEERRRTSLGLRCQEVFRVAKEQTGRGVVVLIDEYDKPVLDVMEVDEELLARHRTILRAFYSIFKLTSEYLRFVFVTGVTEFSQESVFDHYNHLDISLSREYETICGFTEEEITKYFTTAVEELAESMEVSPAKAREQLKQHYNGYHFSHGLTDIYNPFALLNAFEAKRISDYWFLTASPDYWVRLLNRFGQSIEDIVSDTYFPESFINYRANEERPLPMLYQAGYLTIKGCDRRFYCHSFQLDFPNNEVKGGFLDAIANDYFHPKIDSSLSWMNRITLQLKRGDIDGFRDMFTDFFAHIHYTSNVSDCEYYSKRRHLIEPERERYFHYTFFLLLRLMSVFTVYTEKEQSQGCVDCIIETPKYVYIFEFKLDGTAAQALQQIEDKGYARPYAADPRPLRLVGVNFSSEKGTIDDWAVKG